MPEFLGSIMVTHPGWVVGIAVRVLRVAFRFPMQLIFSSLEIGKRPIAAFTTPLFQESSSLSAVEFGPRDL